MAERSPQARGTPATPSRSMGGVRRALRVVSLGLAFVLEIAALLTFGIWGARVASGPAQRVLLAVGLPLFAGLLWGLLASPRARWSSAPGAWLYPYVYFVAAAGALASVGASAWGVLLLMTFLLNRFALAALAPAPAPSGARTARGERPG